MDNDIEKVLGWAKDQIELMDDGTMEFEPLRAGIAAIEALVRENKARQMEDRSHEITFNDEWDDAPDHDAEPDQQPEEAEGVLVNAYQDEFGTLILAREGTPDDDGWNANQYIKRIGKVRVEP